MSLAPVLESAAGLGPENRRRLADSLALTEQCAREVRDLASLLHPPLLHEIGLIGTLKWHVDAFVRHSGIQVTLHPSSELGRMPEEIEMALFRIVQESLANVQRHSGSSTAEIRVDREPDSVRVRVRDRGHGLPPEARKDLDALTPRIGIVGMKERAMQLGGQFSIRSGAGGTTVEVRVPLRAEDQ